MVDIMGHLAFGLLFVLPAWFVWRRRVSLAVVGLGLPTALLPDIDLWLSRAFPAEIHHHGVTHTLAFVVLASLLAGVAAATVVRGPLSERFESSRRQSTRWTRGDTPSPFTVSSLAVFLGGSSHVFADTLSAPDISTPIEPLWPVSTEPWPVDVIYYDDPLWNAGFLGVMCLVHVGVARMAGVDSDPASSSG